MKKILSIVLTLFVVLSGLSVSAIYLENISSKRFSGFDEYDFVILVPEIFS